MGMNTKLSEGEVYVDPGISCGPGKTKQNFREQVNINKMIERYKKTGMLDHVNARAPFYGDVSDIISYQESLAIVARANELFMNMSSTVRERFANDPAKMIAFLQDEKNLDEAVRLGMVTKKPVVESPVVEPPK